MWKDSINIIIIEDNRISFEIDNSSIFLIIQKTNSKKSAAYK